MVGLEEVYSEFAVNREICEMYGEFESRDKW